MYRAPSLYTGAPLALVNTSSKAVALGASSHGTEMKSVRGLVQEPVAAEQTWFVMHAVAMHWQGYTELNAAPSVSSHAAETTTSPGQLQPAQLTPKATSRSAHLTPYISHAESQVAHGRIPE
mmetsp:Transcript_70377/g.199726  ORF Transcript_70377/g.199726 Transcript_70377/m.199726 type:complete len:122 (-) Transcript_70377:52-417(-)